MRFLALQMRVTNPRKNQFCTRKSEHIPVHTKGQMCLHPCMYLSTHTSKTLMLGLPPNPPNALFPQSLSTHSFQASTLSDTFKAQKNTDSHTLFSQPPPPPLQSTHTHPLPGNRCPEWGHDKGCQGVGAAIPLPEKKVKKVSSGSWRSNSSSAISQTAVP